MKTDDTNSIIERNLNEEYASEFGVHHSIQEMDAKSKMGNTLKKNNDKKKKVQKSNDGKEQKK